MLGGPENGGGGHANSVLDLGGPSKFHIWILGVSCKFRIRGKKPVTLRFLHFSVSVQYSTGTPFRYCVEGGGGGGEG